VIAERSRTIAAGHQAVWRLVRDPRALPRWWPRVERVEGVGGDGWTTVLRSERGRVVRADWRLEAEEGGRRRAWSQRLAGTPFERVISERRVEARVESAGTAATTVTLELRQRSRRLGRLGDFVLRGPARRELDTALAGLARELEARPASTASSDRSTGS
jgi:uncharacterized protein YndB with AHSA1/START domain